MLVLDHQRHVDDITCIVTRLGIEGPRLRYLCTAEQARGLLACRHRYLKGRCYPSLGHAVVLRRADVRVLAADSKAIETAQEARVDELRAVVRANVPHARRGHMSTDIGQDASKNHRHVRLALQKLWPAQSRVAVHHHHDVLRVDGGGRPSARQVYKQTLKGPRRAALHPPRNSHTPPLLFRTPSTQQIVLKSLTHV